MPLFTSLYFLRPLFVPSSYRPEGHNDHNIEKLIIPYSLFLILFLWPLVFCLQPLVFFSVKVGADRKQKFSPTVTYNLNLKLKIMAKVSTYLNFPRNTEEAFNFYRSVFGTEFGGQGIMRLGDVPPQEGMPKIADVFGIELIVQ